MRMMLNERRQGFRNATARKRPTNVSLDVALVEEAKTLGINMSQACEDGLAAATKQERERRWLEENRAAMSSYNEYIERNGVPLAHLRQF